MVRSIEKINGWIAIGTIGKVVSDYVGSMSIHVFDANGTIEHITNRYDMNVITLAIHAFD